MKLELYVGTLMVAFCAPDVLFSVKWNLDQPVPSEKLSGPITKFGVDHPKTKYGVCGGVRSDRLIPATDAWSTSGATSGSTCQSMVGAAAFYGYSWPNAASANTGNEGNDVLFTYFVKDIADQTYLVVAIDKASNPDAGALTLEMDSPKLKGVNAGVPLCDDGSECKPGFDKNTGKGSFNWGWATCCGDGMVFGPLPAKDYCFNFKASSYRGLSQFGFGGWDTVTDKFDKVTMPLSTFNKGVSVCALEVGDYCGQMSTCGECADQAGKCGWCHESGKVGCKPVSFKGQCNAWTDPGTCCQNCASVTNAISCLASSGCAWCYTTGKCISHHKGTTCSACATKQISEPNVGPQYCPGPVDGSNTPVDALSQPVVTFCSNKGTCDSSQFKCTCQTGYFGVGCEKVCGSCDSGGSCGRDDGLCICDVNMGGAGCGSAGCSAQSGYCRSGPACVQCGLVMSDGKSCTGIFDQGLCKCQKGYWGSNCENACPGINIGTGSGTICGGFGTCASDGKCTCAPCYQTSSAGICVPEADPNCGAGVVMCNAQTGNKECKCPGHLGGSGCSTCLCKNGMQCNSITKLCECGTNYIGDHCDLLCTRAGACNGNGECNAQTSSCKCDPAWLGKFCDQPAYQCTPPPPGKYVSKVCDPVNQVDTVFTNCSSVSAGSYIATACQAGTTTKLGANTDIKVCTGCPSGQYRTGCGGNSAGICNNCASCGPGKYLVGCSGNNAGTCTDCGSCGAGRYRTSCGTAVPYSSSGSCNSCSTCPATQYLANCGTAIPYSSTGSCVACGSCPSGQYRASCGGVLVGSCTACSSCPAGQYNKDCGAASLGYIYTGSCTSCSGCPGGQFRSGCTGISPGSCGACASCPSGQYRSGCGGLNVGSCSSCPTCPSGQYNNGCTGISSGVCNACGTCPSGQYRSGCTGISAGSCTACAACPSGQYRTGCSNLNPGTCTACVTNCPAGQYKNGCSGLNAGSCSVCPTCSNGQYRSGCSATSSGSCTTCQTCGAGTALLGCMGTSPGTCTACQSCPTGQWRSGCVGASAGTCTTCATCPSGQFMSGCTGVNQGACAACPTCPAGFYTKDCSGLSGGSCAACAACPSGQYRKNCNGGNPGSCEACATCNSNQYNSVMCTGTTLNTCLNCGACPVGQERVGCGPTTTNSGQCQATKSPTLAPTRTPKPTSLPTIKPTVLLNKDKLSVTSCTTSVTFSKEILTVSDITKLEYSYARAVEQASGLKKEDIKNAICFPAKSKEFKVYKCKAQTASSARVLVTTDTVTTKLQEDIGLYSINNGLPLSSVTTECDNPPPPAEKAKEGTEALIAAATDLSNIQERPSLYALFIGLIVLVVGLPFGHTMDKKLQYAENLSQETSFTRKFLSRHLWFSIIFRDPASKFSSKERVLCLTLFGFSCLAASHAPVTGDFMVHIGWLSVLACLPRLLFGYIFAVSAQKEEEADDEIIAEAFEFERPKLARGPYPPPPPPPGNPPPPGGKPKPVSSPIPIQRSGPGGAPPRPSGKPPPAASKPANTRSIPDMSSYNTTRSSSPTTKSKSNRPKPAAKPKQVRAWGRPAKDEPTGPPAKCGHGMRVCAWFMVFFLMLVFAGGTIVFGLATGDIVTRCLIMGGASIVFLEPMIVLFGRIFGCHTYAGTKNVKNAPVPKERKVSVSSVIEADNLLVESDIED